MHGQALRSNVHAFGEEHISTLITVHHLGILYGSQGKLGKAEKVFLRALQGYNKAVGLDGISTYIPSLNTLWALGLVHDSLGHIDQARAWYSKVLLFNGKVFGEDHARCQLVRDDLAALVITDGDNDIPCESVM
ncbi:glycosyl hydrolase family 20 [Stagonosporopsis vannaccii]|nr:glycosyl hydrolase family 20 [Stagonosporopsis vannaccii]